MDLIVHGLYHIQTENRIIICVVHSFGFVRVCVCGFMRGGVFKAIACFMV